MKILSTPSSFGINDAFSYHGGSMGNIGYSFFKSLSNHPVQIYATVQSHLLSSQFPNIHFYDTGYDRKKLYNTYKLVKQILSKHKIDLIFSPYFFYGISFTPFREIKNYPFIIGMCELPHHRFSDEVDMIKNKYIRNIGKQLLKPLFLNTLSHCDKLIVVNEGAKKLYLQHIQRSKIEIIPYGVDIDRFQCSPLTLNNNILIVSRLIKRRNIDVLMEALPSVLREYPRTILHIVGGGVQWYNLHKLSKSLNIGKNIIFYGGVTSDKLISLYKNCYLYCSLSEEDGWNQPILEAMSIGRPVISPDALHNSMVTSKTGFKLHYNDCIECASKIKELFGDFKMAQKMGKEGRKEAERNYNWSNIGRKYYEVYKEVI